MARASDGEITRGTDCWKDNGVDEGKRKEEWHNWQWRYLAAVRAKALGVGFEIPQGMGNRVLGYHISKF